MCRKTEPAMLYFLYSNCFPIGQLGFGAWVILMLPSICRAKHSVETSGINQVEIHFFRWNFLVGTLHLRAKKSFLAT